MSWTDERIDSLWRAANVLAHIIAVQLLTLNDVAERLRISKVTIWRHRKAGEFPLPVDVGDGSPRFVEDEIRDWYEARRMTR